MAILKGALAGKKVFKFGKNYFIEPMLWSQHGSHSWLGVYSQLPLLRTPLGPRVSVLNSESP